MERRPNYRDQMQNVWRLGELNEQGERRGSVSGFFSLVFSFLISVKYLSNFLVQEFNLSYHNRDP